ncbi:MAG: hypothetical protein K9N09_03740 [Candidatus Cloacimonetes bacterium]|nr:hypothetical protein [Candidatus Cloacimonadota bacterium]MCF7813725.1 hypothetical protein [Candidatus Cloacimonadota bacterium]MCF7867791.1 hypothetical protein [Candidatus Cloacimonadota bacterium]MCF7883231.1 hypothetical protein [Candidatus Cloacimonadota bacterium]
MKKIFILFFVFCFSVMFAQSFDVNIELTTPMGTYFNTFYPANFNPEEPDSQPEFFVMNFSTTASSPLEDYKIHVEVTRSDAQANVDLITNDFSPEIPVNPAFLRLTNRDIVNNDPVDFDNSGDYDDLLSDIEDFVLSSGRMPDGDYNFWFEVRDLNDNPLSDPVSTTITIQSPISISLITPGYPLGSFGPMNLMNQYPEFIWFSNLANYTFDLYHIDEEIESAEEIELLDKYYTTTTISNSIVYPGSAASLENSEIYAWRVSAPLSSPGSTETYQSVFYTFKIDMEEEDEVEEVIVINFLNQLNTGDITVLQNLLNNGYNISTITWQGQEISVDELMNILNQLANGELDVLE